MQTQFEKPLRATKHCRHYSYEPGLQGGPRCAEGVDLSEPRAIMPCVAEPEVKCSQRKDYTDDERQTWKLAVAARLVRLGAAIGALPHPVPVNTSGTVECPNCSGRLHYSRWHRGASLVCATEYCCGAHFNIAAGTDWPVSTASDA